MVINRKLFAIPVLQEFYKCREYQAAWVEIINIEQVIKAIENISEDGLNPNDYHLEKIEEIFQEFKKSDTIYSKIFAEFDILLTDPLFLLSSHIITGKVHPESLKDQWMIEVQFYKRNFEEVAALIDSSLVNHQIYELVESIKPKHYMYTGLKKALKNYKQYHELGGWDEIPSGTTLKLGSKDERVIAVRARLLASNKMKTYIEENDSIYDEVFQNNIRSFQKKIRNRSRWKYWQKYFSRTQHSG